MRFAKFRPAALAVSLNTSLLAGVLLSGTGLYADELVELGGAGAGEPPQQGRPATEAAAIPRGPGDVPARLEADARPKEATFDFPAIDEFIEPWSAWKARLADKYGLRLGFDYQPVVQWADNSVGEDSAAGGILRGFSSWDMWGKDDPTRAATLDVRIEHRHRIDTALPPETLAPNFGWAGTTAPDWSDQGWGVPVLMLRQRLDVGNAPIELRVGRMSPFSQFDITPYSDNLTTFQNNSLILNPTIGYPSAGSVGVGGYVGIPGGNFYALGMVMDANGSYDELGVESLGDGDYFSALEFGWTDQELSGLTYLFNNFHVALWHNDLSGEGVALTGSYTFSDLRWGLFGRLGWASSDSKTLYDRYASAGVVRSVLRDSLVGLGVSWGEVPDTDEEQVATEVFYRWQMSQKLALTPSIQVLSNPAFNPGDDTVTVLGIRARIAF